MLQWAQTNKPILNFFLHCSTLATSCVGACHTAALCNSPSRRHAAQRSLPAAAAAPGAEVHPAQGWAARLRAPELPPPREAPKRTQEKALRSTTSSVFSPEFVHEPRTPQEGTTCIASSVHTGSCSCSWDPSSPSRAASGATSLHVQ